MKSLQKTTKTYVKPKPKDAEQNDDKTTSFTGEGKKTIMLVIVPCKGVLYNDRSRGYRGYAPPPKKISSPCNCFLKYCCKIYSAFYVTV